MWDGGQSLPLLYLTHEVVAERSWHFPWDTVKMLLTNSATVMNWNLMGPAMYTFVFRRSKYWASSPSQTCIARLLLHNTTYQPDEGFARVPGAAGQLKLVMAIRANAEYQDPSPACCAMRGESTITPTRKATPSWRAMERRRPQTTWATSVQPARDCLAHLCSQRNCVSS